MSSPQDEGSTRRASRREAARRRRLRRRRRFAAAFLLAGALGLAFVLTGTGGGSSHRVASTALAARTRSAVSETKAVRSRAPARRARPGTEAVPILMYHVIAPPLATAPYPGLYVPPSEFAAQMEALARAGYHAVTLDQVRSSWLRGTPLPPRPIVLSFDNGYRTQFTVALPVLRRLHWVGDENLQLSGLPPSQGGLGPREVRLLVAAGWELDTQGFSHADLTALDPAELHYQVAVARKLIRQRYHVRADWFCYPSGRYNPTVVAAVRAAGYVGSTTVVPGWATPSADPYRLPPAARARRHQPPTAPPVDRRLAQRSTGPFVVPLSELSGQVRPGADGRRAAQSSVTAD